MDWVQTLKCVSYSTCVFAIASAFFWTSSALVAVPFTRRHRNGELKQEQKYLIDKKGRKIDIPETMQKQAELNKLAATLSAIAAISLAMQTFIQAQMIG